MKYILAIFAIEVMVKLCRAVVNRKSNGLSLYQLNMKAKRIGEVKITSGEITSGSSATSMFSKKTWTTANCFYRSLCNLLF